MSSCSGDGHAAALDIGGDSAAFDADAVAAEEHAKMVVCGIEMRLGQAVSFHTMLRRVYHSSGDRHPTVESSLSRGSCCAVSEAHMFSVVIQQ